MIKLDNMVMIGATARNSGKTTLAEALVNHYKDEFKVIALKISREHEIEETDLPSYSLIEEKSTEAKKDTSKFLKAGAFRVFRLKTNGAGLVRGFEDFLSFMQGDELIICESNSLRNFVKPAVLILMKNLNQPVKPSAESILIKADVIYDKDVSEILEKAIELIDGKIRIEDK